MPPTAKKIKSVAGIENPGRVKFGCMNPSENISTRKEVSRANLRPYFRDGISDKPEKLDVWKNHIVLVTFESDLGASASRPLASDNKAAKS